MLLYYLSCGGLEEPQGVYGARFEETETEELLCFIKRAVQEVERRGILLSPPIETIRVTKTLRVFVGRNELKIRPMAKTILLLFLKHPEGIALKQIASYESELAILYRRVSRSSSPAEIEYRVKRILDLFNNDLNVNIARVNRAVAALVDNAAWIGNGWFGSRKNRKKQQKIVRNSKKTCETTECFYRTLEYRTDVNTLRL